MKKTLRSQTGFSSVNVLLGLVLGSLGLFLALIGFGFSMGSSALAQGPKGNHGRARTAAVGAKIAPEVVAETANGKNASVVIFLTDQADVSAAYKMKDQDARGWFVYNTLTQHAARTQAGLKEFLTARGIAFQSFWAANMIVATVDLNMVQSLAARSDVARISSNKPARWIEKPELADLRITPKQPDDPTTTEWGVNNVNAPLVWAMGFTGQGIVVGDLDTGMRWTHVALKPKYRGWNGTTADHNYNWHDAIHTANAVCPPDQVEPCDDSGHGTHTAATTVGDDGEGNQVGVAPGAKWIGCRNMNDGNGMPSTYTECFQFMIAPTDLAGNNPDPTLRPHVLNNSWGCPVSEGCTTGAELETIVNNTQAAGIFVEVSAGNAGSGCSTVEDAPAIYEASFSTGAININNGLAGFSSRGPSLFYTPNLLKPNVSAPGVNVRSAYSDSDTQFANLNGTSMAGPHVVGVVALLWSARPQLARDIEATKMILQNTANPNVTLTTPQTCGGISSTEIPNNSFGYGRVDAFAAVNSIPAGCVRTALTEDFDSVTAPALPSGWVATNAVGSAPLWVTTTTSPESAPNALYVDDPGSLSDKTIETPEINIASTEARILFRHRYDFDHTATVAFDGGVLEISSPNIAGGAFKDITDPAVGGSFLAGGYNATISVGNNPIAGRMAWGGASGGYVISWVNLGPNVAGQTVKLRFRMGSDSVAAGEVGWYVDGISITDGTCPTLANISTRLQVETDNNVLIGGFIITGTQPKKVIVRAIGPSLTLPGKLANPTLELRDGTGQLIRANDDWRSDQEAEIIATTIPPTNDLESAIVETLPASGSAYTAIVRGANNGTGIGLVEAYDLDRTVDSKLANISTRGLVQTDNNVLIGGTIVLGSGTQRVIVRAIGPSLTLQGKLADPTLELRDGNGTLVRANDNWRSDQEAEIIATGIPPTNDLESAIVSQLSGNGAAYTAIVRGAEATTGVAVVEVYALDN